MQLLRLLLVIATTAAVVGSYFQEMHRLALIKRMPGDRARAYYEATRERSERLLAGVTVGLALGAIAAAVYVFLVPR